MNKDILEKLRLVCYEAVSYVGSANYHERELAAKKAINAAFLAAKHENIAGGSVLY